MPPLPPILCRQTICVNIVSKTGISKQLDSGPDYPPQNVTMIRFDEF